MCRLLLIVRRSKQSFRNTFRPSAVLGGYTERIVTCVLCCVVYCICTLLVTWSNTDDEQEFSVLQIVKKIAAVVCLAVEP